MDLLARIQEYYKIRELKMPTVEEALMFVQTELAEVYELLLAREGGWTRNNPENKPQFTTEALGEELGDAIMMLIVAGWAEGVDPVKAIFDKIDRKLTIKTTREPLPPVQGNILNEIRLYGEDTYRNFCHGSMTIEMTEDNKTLIEYLKERQRNNEVVFVSSEFQNINGNYLIKKSTANIEYGKYVWNFEFIPATPLPSSTVPQ